MRKESDGARGQEGVEKATPPEKGMQPPIGLQLLLQQPPTETQDCLRQEQRLSRNWFPLVASRSIGINLVWWLLERLEDIKDQCSYSSGSCHFKGGEENHPEFWDQSSLPVWSHNSSAEGWEAYLTDLFEDTNLCAIYATCVTIMAQIYSWPDIFV